LSRSRDLADRTIPVPEVKINLVFERNTGGVMLEKNGLRKQRVYTLAVSLAAYVLRATSRIPADARPVRRQLIRSVTSIGLNVAEGWGESSPAEKARFYRIARRSATETVGALDIMVALGLIGSEIIERTDRALDEIHAILTKMAKTQEAAAAAQPRRGRERRRSAIESTTQDLGDRKEERTITADPP
jgi:four helix bundle protein